MGTEPNFFGVPGAAEHAFPLYSADDAETPAQPHPAAVRGRRPRPGTASTQGALNFVIVGGGATGVETAGALADLIHDVMPRAVPRPRRRARPTITLVDHGDVVLAPFSDKAHAYAAKVAREEGRRAPARRIGHRGRKPTGSVFADGIRDPDPLRRLGRRAEGRARSRARDAAETGRGGGSASGQDLSVDGFPGRVRRRRRGRSVDGPDGDPYPQLGSVALQAGRRVAASILADHRRQADPVVPLPRQGDHGDDRPRRRRRRDGRAPPRAPRPRRLRRLARRARLAAQHHPSPHRRLHELGVGLVLQQPGPAIIDDPDAPRIDWGDDDRRRTTEHRHPPPHHATAR